jgi:transposase
MAAVMIGVDPHTGSHTAVAIGTAEEVQGQLRVRACAEQAQQLLAWSEAWPERTWAVEGAGGLGHLLSQQLVAAGEDVLDVPPKLAARVRLLASGNVNKNDPNDARSVAVAALRSAACLPVRAEDHAAVLKIWAKRHRDLSRARNQVVCRLHAVLCDLVPGGVSKRITAGQAARFLEQVQPRGAAGAARWILAEQFLTDLRRIDAQRSDVKKKLATAVRASGTTVTEIFGVGPAVAAAVLGDARRAAGSSAGPGGHPGNGSVASVAGLHPADRLFGQATPGPDPTIRPQPTPPKGTRPAERTRRPAPAHTSA